MTLHHEETASIAATPSEVFAYLDDPMRLASHMGKSSRRMGGGRMDMSVDEGGGQKIGSHIRLDGTAFGLRVFLDEVVTEREPPLEKQWQTVGAHRLLVIGDYAMGLNLEPAGTHAKLRIFIDYNLPRENAWLGTLFAGLYAKWCVGMMLNDARAHFAHAAPAGSPYPSRP